MKLMFISDIHGSETCLQAALERYEIEKPDKMVICGDILYHGPRNPIPEGYNPKGVISLLNPLKEVILAVRGNCDSEVDQMVLEFPIQGDYQQMILEEIDIFISHGHLYDNAVPKQFSKGLYVQGHSHIPMIEQKNKVWHFNPGSITLPKEGHKRTYGIYENGVITVKTLDGDDYFKQPLGQQ